MDETRSSLPVLFLAAAGGLIAAHALKFGGPMSELHERAHALAGRVLTTSAPKVCVHDWANWNHVVQASGISGKLKETAKVVFGYYGVGGRTSFSSDLSRLGELIGWPAAKAAITVAGPASTLMVHSVFLLGGIHQRRERPALATFLISFGIVGHFLDCGYPLGDWAKLSSASIEGVKDLLKGGRDFVKIAVYLHNEWGLHYSSAAYAVAVCWTISVPCVGLWASSEANDDQPSADKWYTKFFWGAVSTVGVLFAVALERRIIEQTGLLFAIHSSAIVAGVHQRKRRPRLAKSLIGFAILGHVTARHHPLTVLAALSSSDGVDELVKNMDSLLVTYAVLKELTGVYIMRLSYFASKALLMSVPLIGMGASLWPRLLP